MEENIKSIGLNRAKNTFGNLFLIFVVFLMILPFLTTFNEFLTRIVESTFLYIPIKNIVVPYEVMLVRTILSFFNIETLPGTISIIKNGVVSGMYISWNCIGWQSFVILLISLKTGLSGDFTRTSVFGAAAMGLLGTFFINLFRITLVIILLYFFGKAPAIFFHDYSSVIISIVWLFAFWWFSYNFILEPNEKA